LQFGYLSALRYLPAVCRTMPALTGGATEHAEVE
jgi:hypothetical protein